MQKPILVVVMNNFGIGGVQQVWRNVLPHLVDRYEAHLVAYKSDQGPMDELHQAGVTTHFIPSSGRLHWKTIRDYRDLFRRLKADIVHSNSHSPNVFCPIAAKLAHVPINVAHIHANDPYWFASSKLGKLKQNIEESLVHRNLTSKIVTVSKILLDKYTKEMFLPRELFLLMHNGIQFNYLKNQDLSSENNLRQKLNMEPNQLLLGYVGRINKAKGLDYLLSLAKNLTEANLDFKIAVFGKASPEDLFELQTISNTIDNGKRVIFMGETQTPNLFYPQFDLFLFPSPPAKEGMATVVLEAASYNLPILARAGGPEAEILPYYSKLLFFDDYSTPLEAIQAALKLPADNLVALRHFSAEAMAERLHSLYQGLKN